MANKIQVKRSAVAAKVPTTGDLDLGEIAINTFDGKMFIKKDNGTASIVEIGGGSGSGDVVGPASATDNAIARYDNTTGKLIQNSTVTINDDGTIGGVNGIELDTTPTNAPTAIGSIAWDVGDGTPYVILDADVSLQLGQENVAKVYNGSGATITKGKVVAVSGAQGQRPSIVLADSDSEALSAPTLGITAEDISNGAEGFVCTFGLLRGIDTSTFTAGQPIYLSSTAGAFTATKPVAPQHIVALGWVIKVNASSGEIFININNGWELDELHNVLITSPQSGNTLIYDATAGVWKNANLTAGSGITITNAAGAITIASSGSLPSQTGNAGKYLTTDGSTASWAAIAGALATPTFTASTTTPTGGATITVTITNYNASYTYTIAVSQGTYTFNAGTGVVSWTVPNVAAVTSASLTAFAQSGVQSSLVGTQTISIQASLVVDTPISITNFASYSLNNGWAI
jgi:hypothetical protein